jgi:hypothetical protein
MALILLFGSGSDGEMTRMCDLLNGPRRPEDAENETSLA